MAGTTIRKPKKQKVKQGHKLVWLTLIIILIPVAIVGYVLFTSAQGNDKPVIGSRYSGEDLNPRIDPAVLTSIQTDAASIPGVESATINLNSATVRLHLNMADDLDESAITDAAQQAYSIVNSYLPIDTYFTDSADGKNYDLEVDSYNWIVSDSNPAAGQIYVKITKNGPGKKVVDVLTKPKDAELAESVRNHVLKDGSLTTDLEGLDPQSDEDSQQEDEPQTQSDQGVEEVQYEQTYDDGSYYDPGYYDAGYYDQGYYQ